MNRLRTFVEKIKRWFDHLSIQIKLIGAYILIILVPVIVISNYLFTNFYENTIQDIIKENQSVMENEKHGIMNKIEIMERSAQLVVSDEQLLNYASADSEPSVLEVMKFESSSFNYIQRLLFNNPDIANIYFFVPNTQISEIWPIIYHEKRVKDRAAYQNALKEHGDVLWEILKDEEEILDNNPSKRTSSYVSIIRKIYYPGNQYLGMIEVDMKIEDVFSKAYKLTGDKDSQLFILDRHGNVHRNNTSALPGVKVSRIKQIVEEKRQADKTSFVISDQGFDFLYIMEHIDKLDADIVRVISLQSTYSKIDETRNRMILVIIGLLALLATITFLMQSMVLKKLHILRDSMKMVRKGDFNVDINVQGGDEIGELAHHFRQMLKKINELIVEAVNRSAATKEAELQSLRNQIDAHFLYNTLENLKMLSEVEGQYILSDALTSLGSIMRYNLKWTDDRVQLRDEINHIRHYISIMNIRYDNKLHLDLDIPDGYWNQELLKMSLQPIVENALKHGIYSALMKNEGLLVNVRAYVKEDSFFIEVTDNGIGMTEDKLREINERLMMGDEQFKAIIEDHERMKRKGSGIGLRNVDQRLQMYYGYDNGIHIESQRGSYTKVVVKLPSYTLKRGGEE
ncbi:MAG: sensor histidine kinase [Paenibacillus sp.]|nr:sensor histidine kinase [Paenibacillus sp.]